MEVHQSLPARYLHNPYLVKTETTLPPPPPPSSQQQQQQQILPPQAVVVAVTATSQQQSTSSGISESCSLSSSSPVSSNQRTTTHTVDATNSSNNNSTNNSNIDDSQGNSNNNENSNSNSSCNNGNITSIQQQQQQSRNGTTATADYRLYGRDISTVTATTATTNAQIPHSSSTNIHQNGRPLTADRKRPYNCNMCSSRFGSKMELEEHQNSHTGEKPFECNMCKARFNRRSTLWNHKRIHSDDKPFECNVCRMTFKWKNSLKCHKEMHQRKNEMTGIENDPLEKTLTYATAAKRRHLENHDVVNVSSSSETEASSVRLITSSASGVNHLTGPGRRRNTKLSVHARSIASTRTDLIIGTTNIPNSTNRSDNTASNNSSTNNSTVSSAHSLLSLNDAFIHAPLQADGFFSSQKALSISDHKELDSLLNSTTRLTSMLKDDSAFKTNLCDDLASLGNQGNAFDAKQEMNQQQQQQQQQPFVSQYSTGGTSSQPSDMLANHNHNVISYQPQLEAPSSLISPELDYAVSGDNLEYMLSNYSSTISSAPSVPPTGNEVRSSVAEHLQQQQYTRQTAGSNALRTDDVVVANVATAGNTGKEVPQVSW
ncbi:unnamed protein product [Litomosoides sigmodontis]|uniref:C2H2-type domain-containing protein n=1 Tax=Litomosoides sigmodontis TaxID=42156 RepID=A0A3P6ULM1_LITSI|nr:unnamed protein product [Litomosoides sigmodontis]